MWPRFPWALKHLAAFAPRSSSATPPFLPINRRYFSTASDGQTSVEIHVLQGEREMAAGNKDAGEVPSGTASRPRREGIPQIEVTFDIDANGIVNVSAKDKGTNKEQKITITASTNLSKTDIERAVKEAEQFAEEDKKQKEKVDTKNNAEALIFQTEKSLKDLGDKVSEAEKAPVQAELDKLKETVKTDNTEAIKAGIESLSKAFYAIAEKLYQQAPDTGSTGNTDSAAGGQNTQEADYQVVDDDESK